MQHNLILNESEISKIYVYIKRLKLKSLVNGTNRTIRWISCVVQMLQLTNRTVDRSNVLPQIFYAPRLIYEIFFRRDVPFLRFQCLTLYNLTNTKQRKKHIKQNGLFRFKSKIVERFQNNIFISIYLLLAMDLFQTFQCRPSLTNTKMYCCQEPICPSGLFPKNIRKCSSDWQCPINHQCINSRNIEG